VLLVVQVAVVQAGLVELVAAVLALAVKVLLVVLVLIQVLVLVVVVVVLERLAGTLA
jgi:hypothetical protein